MCRMHPKGTSFGAHECRDAHGCARAAPERLIPRSARHPCGAHFVRPKRWRVLSNAALRAAQFELSRATKTKRPRKGAFQFLARPERWALATRGACRRANALLGANAALRAAQFELSRATKTKRPRKGAFQFLARPERFELPTTWFEARYSIQLSYGRMRSIVEGRMFSFFDGRREIKN